MIRARTTGMNFVYRDFGIVRVKTLNQVVDFKDMKKSPGKQSPNKGSANKDALNRSQISASLSGGMNEQDMELLDMVDRYQEQEF
jgi:hypothetical protein